MNRGFVDRCRLIEALISNANGPFPPTTGLTFFLTCTCDGLTTRIDNVSGGGTPTSTVLCELTEDMSPVLSPLCVAEDSWHGEGFQVCFDRCCCGLQLASSSPAQLEDELRLYGSTSTDCGPYLEHSQTALAYT